MKKLFQQKWSLMVVMILTLALSIGGIGLAHAEGEAESDAPAPGQISISISPVTANFDHLEPNSTYDGVLNVTNAGNEQFDFEVFSAPYSFSLSETTDTYGPNYTTENNYTQIARWITIRDQAGNYVQSVKDDSDNHPTFSAAPGETIQVAYRVTTPDSIPAGGQYAALFAQTLPKESNTSGISALANLGMKVFGRSENGEIIRSAEIKDLSISQTYETEGEVEENGQTVRKEVTLNQINGYAVVKNTGNVDFNARGVLKVTNLFGEVYYETPENKAQVSIIPDSELPVSDVWEETPTFGLFRANWTITAGETTEGTEIVIFLVPPFVIVLTIIFLTIIIIGIIMAVRRRKERRSRFAV